MKKITVGEIPVDLFTVDSLHQTIKDTILQGRKELFLHANARLVELANTQEKWLIEFFNEPRTFVLCDGAGIQLAARITKQPIPEKIPYNIWMWNFIKFISNNSFSVFLLGSDEITVQNAVKRLRERNINLKIVGFRNGYFNKQKNHTENENVIEQINSCKPDILLVGFGMPIQEKWVKENRERLNVPAIFTCGGAFDFISGRNRVAPVFFRKYYLEWLFRFFLEPARLFRRAFYSNLVFIKIVSKQALGQNLRR